MAIRIIGADERIKASLDKTSLFVVGSYGVGKTSLLFTLDPATTLCIDFEGGLKSAQIWKGDVVEIRTFEDACDIACLIGGANPALAPNDLFSQAHYDHVKALYANIDLTKYKTIFFDSLSDLTDVARNWAKQQPGAITKHGAGDLRGMYGVLAENVTGFVRHMQHAPGKTIIFVARLEQVKDDFGRITFQPQLAGQKAGREIPGIVDCVVSMSLFDYSEATGWVHNFESGKHRAFCCLRLNPYGLPAKERSMGNIDIIEEPHLGRLIEKINAPAREEAAAGLKYGLNK